MADNKKYILIILGLLFFCIYGLQPEECVGGLQSFVVARLGLGVVEITSGDMVLLFSSMFPVILVEMMEGISIYKHYIIGSVYYFIRQKDIGKWYDKEIGKILLLIFKIFFVFVLCGCVIGCVIFKEYPSFSITCMVLCQCAMYVTYTFIFVLLMNLLSILLGADLSYVITIGVQLLLLMSLLFFGNEELLVENTWLLRFNPISCMIIVWHYIPYLDFSNMDRIGVDFDVLCSVAYLAFIGFVIYIIGKKIVLERDIAMDNKEEQG